MSETTAKEPVDLGWCILELMGHRRLAGKVSEEPIFGTNMLRIDVPGEGEEWVATQYYGGASIYCVSPCDEATARKVAASCRPAPVQRWELPPAVDQGISFGDSLDADEDDQDQSAGEGRVDTFDSGF